MDDIIDAIGEIYEAIGDADRWRRVEQRLADSGEPEIRHHLDVARQAHERHVRARTSVDVLAGLHDQIVPGALLVDDRGVLLRANSAASRLLAAGGGLRLADGRVEAVDAAEQVALLNAIADACAGARAGDMFVVVTRPARRPVCVVVLPAGRRVATVFETGALALLLVVDPDAPGAPGADLLRALFDFTAREAEVAALLMEGRSIEEAARILGVSVTTARTFLAHLSAKTESHSQAELVGRLLAIPPLP